MFRKWTGKEVKRFIICLVVYLLLALAAAFTGFLGPVFWIVIYPIVGAFVEAGPITCVASMKRGFGSAAILPLILLICSLIMGELSMTLMVVWAVSIVILTEVLHITIGAGKLTSIRVAAPVGALMPVGQSLPLFFMKDAYLEHAALEMDADYVEGLGHLTSPVLIILIIVLSFLAASISERITEKILKIEQ